MTDGRILAVIPTRAGRGPAFYCHGKSVFKKIDCDLAKRGAWTDSACPLTKPKFVLNFKKDSSDRFPVDVYIADFDADPRIKNAKPFANKEEAIRFAYHWTRDNPASSITASRSTFMSCKTGIHSRCPPMIKPITDTLTVSHPDRCSDECSLHYLLGLLLLLLQFTHVVRETVLLLPWTTSTTGPAVSWTPSQDTAHRCPRQARRALWAGPLRRPAL